MSMDTETSRSWLHREGASLTKQTTVNWWVGGGGGQAVSLAVFVFCCSVLLMDERVHLMSESL